MEIWLNKSTNLGRSELTDVDDPLGHLIVWVARGRTPSSVLGALRQAYGDLVEEILHLKRAVWLAVRWEDQLPCAKQQEIGEICVRSNQLHLILPANGTPNPLTER